MRGDLDHGARPERGEHPTLLPAFGDILRCCVAKAAMFNALANGSSCELSREILLTLLSKGLFLPAMTVNLWGSCDLLER